MKPDALELEPAAGGLRLRVRAKPGARRNRIVGAHGGALKVEVTAAPERGKANTAIAKLLATELGLAGSQVSVTSGFTSHNKKVVIRGCSVEQVAERLGVAARMA